MKILHSADWHIGNFKGPEEKGKNLRLIDTLGCLEFLVNKAEEEKPELILVSGDIFHQAKVWADRGLSETRQAIGYIDRLGAVAPTVVMLGTRNHDGEEQFKTLKAYNWSHDVYIEDKPTVLRFNGADVALLPGFDRGVFRAKFPGLSKEEENETFTKELANMVLGLKAECDESRLNILMSHYTVPGAVMESGQIAYLQQFEPVLPIEALNGAGFDLVALGHIHRPQEVENCPRVFYSGAVNRLTFNDEGQDRGFYIHDVTKGAINSHYVTTPARDFLTIRLDDEAIASFETTPDLFQFENTQEIDRAIVRVLYSCSDEHNKALNKPVMEKRLLELGAFWVQEITPEKIYISTAKASLDGERSPEELLASYLEEKEYNPEKIASLVDTARPIIDTAMEKYNVSTMSGTFTPLEIEVKNYRNYQEERFDYTTVSFCTINGSNGVGKSSLFMDAMLDALYEEPREGDLTGWISNREAARSGMIKFTFAIGEKVFRVTRTRQKSGKATLNISEKVEGEWVDRSAEKYKDTQEIINHIVGMDSLMLRSCGLIMQDQYGLFLQTDKEDRMAILGNMLGLSVYSFMENLAHENALNNNRQIKSLKDKVDEIVGNAPNVEAESSAIKELEERVASVNADLSQFNDKVANIRLKLDTKLQAQERASKLQEEILTLQDKKAKELGTIETLETDKAKAEAILSKEDDIKAGLALLAKKEEDSKALLERKGLYDTKKCEYDNTKRRYANKVADRNNAVLALEDDTRKLDALKVKLEAKDVLESKFGEYKRLEVELEEAEDAADQYNATFKQLGAAKDLRMQKISALQAATDTARTAYESALKETRLLDGAGCPISETASCKFLKSAVAAKDKLPSLKTAFEFAEDKQLEVAEEHDNGISRLEEKLKGYNYDQNRVKSIKSQIAALESSAEDYKALDAYQEQADDMEDRVEKHKAQVEKETAEVEELEREMKVIEEDLNTIKGDALAYYDLKDEVDSLKHFLEDEKALPVAREKLSNIAERVTDCNKRVAEYSADISSKKDQLLNERTSSDGSSGLQDELKTMEAAIDGRQAELQNLSRSIGVHQSAIDSAKQAAEKSKEYSKQIEALSLLATDYETLQRAFNQDGIPHNIVRTILPTFEEKATEILGQMSGGKMALEFKADKVLKSNKKKEVATLDIIVNDTNTGRLPYLSRSGGEKVKASLSVILALAEIKASNVGVQLGFLFIDEPPFLDAEGVEAYCDALEAIQERYKDLKVMAITHDPTMKARFPESVDVVKSDEGSKVIF